MVGGSLITLPAAAQAATPPLIGVATPPAATDTLTVTAEGDKKSAFQFTSDAGDRKAAIGFVSTGGSVRARELGVKAEPAVTAKTGVPGTARAAASAAAATYPTTIRLASENWTAWNSLINVWNRDTWTYVPVTNPGNTLSITANLPPGNYFVTSIYGIYNVNSYLLTASFTVTNKAQTVVLAESSAKEVALKVDDATAAQDASAVWVSLPNGDFVGFAGGYKVRSYVTTASLAGTTLRTHEILTKRGSTALNPTPYRYDLTQSWSHPFPASPITTVKTASLAKTTTTVRAQGVNTTGMYQSVPMLGDSSGAYLATTMRFPATFTEYVTPGVTVSRLADTGTHQLDLGDRTLSAGTSPATTAGVAPFAPTPSYNSAYRQGNRVQFTENTPYGDATGSKGSDRGARVSTRLSAGGEVLKESNSAVLVADLPAYAQTYRLEQTATRKVAWSQLSTKIQSDWTFSSGNAVRGTIPLMDLGLTASGLDVRNRAGSTPVTLTVVPSTRVAATTSTVRGIEWSVDDGATWTDLPFTASGQGVTASLAVPAGAAFVSLRVSAANDQGGKLTRTVLRAFAGPATAGDEAVGDVTISDLKINNGQGLNLSVSGTTTFNASFTATAPSGIQGGGLYLYHGAYNTPDGVLIPSTSCTPVNATTATCFAEWYVYDIRHEISSNALAGNWRAAVWATANDGGHIDRHNAATVPFRRLTYLTATDALPEPVRKGQNVWAGASLIRADWNTGTWQPYASRPAVLQFWPSGPGGKWTNVKTVWTNAQGRPATTVTATVSGSYRYIYYTDPTSNWAVSAHDYVIVR
ncbi:hypothetical protein GCM10025331_19030 [Actinoplanes utahensis]|uniref:Uncharacterized protein n=1 Tax=Actinoplanes utahensis TaxID=1869 RepID=A0A0A6UDH5_ACTUT|nr:hypothetical protein MB27_38100 [Actinoplanes utahensis]GIF29638.1 hypothetical protein Aut01nite_26240 [Actinoplanes utahensis]